MDRVPLTLVTGPANAEKARVVLDAYAAALDREPLLVVPTFPDVDRYRRELAARGVVFGARVERFSGLVREMARRGGVTARAAGRLTRERVAAAAVEHADLQVLGASAATPGFVAALLALCDELGEARIDPGRFYQALRAWAREEPRRAGYAEDLGALFAGYRRGLERLGRVDAPQRTALALDALRLDPARWRGAPVLFYGFDDLTRQQLDAVETLAVHVGAEVTVSLPYEAGRAAFAGRDGTYQDLLALSDRPPVVLEARSEHYAPPARPALHHLERGLYEPGGARPEVDPAAPAVLLLQGGGERAELELVAAHVARLLREGVPAGEIAVVLRRPQTHAALVERVFGAARIPHALAGRRVRAGHTALGRGVLALLACALLDGTADDLLAWLRTPGLLRLPAKADRLEAEARRRGARTAAEARELWEAREWPLEAIDRLRAARRAGPAALCARLAAETQALFAAPHRGQAPVLGGAEAVDARVAATLRAALTELGDLAGRDPALVPPPAELARLLGALEVPVGGDGGADVVTVADPLAVRARRVRALFACGLQEGSWPAPARPEPFLGDAERRAINAVSGLRLALHEDALGAERYLFYAAVSRPTDLLALSWHAADDDGDPAVRSPLVDDVLDLFAAGLGERVQLRALGEAGWLDAALAPTRRELQRAAAAADPAAADEAIAPLADAAVLDGLRARTTWSASALETWVACPVRWFVERFLRPEPLVPDPEPMVRGELAHKVLEESLRALAAERGGPLRPEHLPEAKRLAYAAIQTFAEGYRISPNPERLRAALRRLEADVVRYLEWAARSGSAYAPAHFEVRFGGARDERPAVPLADGVALQGRIDRIDLAPGGDGALVYDYKGATATAQARWAADGRLQLALYMLALPELLGVEADGGLYQPLGGDDPRPRGLLRETADPTLRTVRGDRVDPEAFDAVLAQARSTALDAVGAIRAGRLEPRPATCGWRGGGCSYPSICRCG
jgi:ATP-dependent helicase/DNAse subunit B